MSSEIMVSVLCAAYNHEKYIRQCLDGFVMQKTSFPFEVIVHDDASTDGTADIIREYEAKYPDLIKPIYQTENQYSQGISISKNYLLPNAHGKYVALCEGDDYWTDPVKLQKQVVYMEKHPQCTLCFTNGRYLRGGSLLGHVVPIPRRGKFMKSNSDYNTGEMALLDFVPTASLLYPRWVHEHRPQIRTNSFGGDTFTRLYTTNLGYAHFINEDTCVYRQDVPNSATAVWGSNKERYINATKALISLMDDMDEITNHKYHEQFEYNKTVYEYGILEKEENHEALRSRKYRRYAKSLGGKEYLIYLIRHVFTASYPFIYGIYKKVR